MTLLPSQNFIGKLVDKTAIKDLTSLISSVTAVLNSWPDDKRVQFFYLCYSQAYVVNPDIDCSAQFIKFNYTQSQVTSSRQSAITRLEPLLKEIYDNQGVKDAFMKSGIPKLSWSIITVVLKPYTLEVFNNYTGKNAPPEFVYSKLYFSACTMKDALKEISYRMLQTMEYLDFFKQIIPKDKAGIVSKVTVLLKDVAQDKLPKHYLTVSFPNIVNLKHNLDYISKRSAVEGSAFEKSVLLIWLGFGQSYKSCFNEPIFELKSLDVKNNVGFWSCYNAVKWLCAATRTVLGGGVTGGVKKNNRVYTDLAYTPAEKTIIDGWK